MKVAFPYPVRLQSSLPRLDGQRLGTFTNIDGEAFARPSLNGYWRVDMTVVAFDKQAQLALSAFVTAMSGAATCVVPICTQWRPNDQTGRPLARGGVAPEYTFDHTGFLDDPFPGFTLRAPASHRNSYIDINQPLLSHIWPGMFITLGNRLHQVINVSAIDESETAIRASIMPAVRGSYDAGSVVVVDQLRVLARLESGDQIGVDTSPIKTARLSFIEAFGGVSDGPVLNPVPGIPEDPVIPGEGVPHDFIADYQRGKQ